MTRAFDGVTPHCLDFTALSTADYLSQLSTLLVFTTSVLSTSVTLPTVWWNVPSSAGTEEVKAATLTL
jgi:hypothetical protein